MLRTPNAFVDRLSSRRGPDKMTIRAVRANASIEWIDYVAIDTRLDAPGICSQ